MPNIKGIDKSEGIRIRSGEVNTPDALLNKAEVLLHRLDWPVDKIENFCNDYLESHIPYEQIRVHIYSLDPLSYNITVADPSFVIPDNWWE